MDLHEFFKRPEPFDSFSKEVTFYTSLQGLASALDRIHTFKLDRTDHLADFSRSGSHRDIRPQNVLVNSNTFLFTDFGLSDFKDPFDDRGSQTLWKAGRGDYIAPECYGEQFQRQKVGRAVDIWAFGCMIIDTATYMKLGADGLERFKRQRNVLWRPPIENGYFFRDSSLKKEVLQHVTNLQAQKGGSAYHKLLKAAMSMLLMEPSERLASRQALEALEFVCTVALFDDLKSALVSYNDFLTSQAENGPSQATLWFEMERLNSWATILELYGEALPPAGFMAAAMNSKLSQTLLSDLKGVVDRQHQQMIRDANPSVEVEKSWIFHSQFQKELTDCVQSLFDLLPLKLQKRADFLWTHRLLETSEVDELNTYAVDSRKSQNEPYQQLGDRATVKKNLITLAENLEPHLDLNNFYLDPIKLTDIHTSGTHDFGNYAREAGKVRVLIEPAFLATERAGFDISVEEMTIRKLALARLFSTPKKPVDFRVLDCIGFIDRAVQPGIGRVDYIFKLPEELREASQHQDFGGMAPKDDPQSLIQILESPALGDSDVPPLEQRVNLAQALVGSIHSLHLNGWLHKSLNAYNILLFPNSVGMADLMQPRIIGFAESRPDGEIWTSSGPEINPSLSDYIHPEYRRGLLSEESEGSGQVRFRRVYDYFSLGFLLLEVGLWRSLRSMASKHRSTGTESFKEALKSKYMPLLRSLMGSAYAKAVNKCLQSDFEAETTGSGAEGQLNEFYINVVEPIVDIRVA
ncbi:kinase-like protein [Mytilinidion resinicola]|uniref:Kinase-like protein n=1 Tax=Mytilinidion resinicola TaxID=574789 RepID=A0A6A6YA94_9PEZI|nr:kinase-like protein [Mytilinidion resinicola]KAF2805742.1 kinase-like protein [Mytilinidion resinicola]